jgi:hypothetical protein
MFPGNITIRGLCISPDYISFVMRLLNASGKIPIGSSKISLPLKFSDTVCLYYPIIFPP